MKNAVRSDKVSRQHTNNTSDTIMLSCIHAKPRLMLGKNVEKIASKTVWTVTKTASTVEKTATIPTMTAIPTTLSSIPPTQPES